MIARLREQRTLDALDSLITHLDGLRQDRKFVMIFTEGWPLFRPDHLVVARSRRARRTDARSDHRRSAHRRIRPQGTPDPATGRVMTLNGCERLRIQLSQIDHERDFLSLLQRANRANVSFYPVDARGLLVFDQPTNFDLLPTDDQAILRRRHDFLQRHGVADGWLRGAEHRTCRRGPHEDFSRPRLVLPDELLLDQLRSSMDASAASASK